MLKKSIVFILIILITLSPVYSISLFPKQQADIYSTFKIDKVLYDKQYTAQIYVASITSKVIDGFQITVKYEKSIDTINIYNQLDPYSTKQYTFKVNQLNPKSLEIRSITNNNHKLVFSSPITYTFNGNEQQIQEQQPSITTIQQPTIPQQLVNEPDYISYTSISKLDNEKNIIYFTKDHISSNRITTKNNGDIEYQANYQPYGNIYTQTGQEKFKFSGKELDSSNLYYFGARYYNSNIGRFTQVDPIFKPTESPYQYANNNPIKYVDPTGKEVLGGGLQSVPTGVGDSSVLQFQYTQSNAPGWALHEHTFSGLHNVAAGGLNLALAAAALPDVALAVVIPEYKDREPFYINSILLSYEASYQLLARSASSFSFRGFASKLFSSSKLYYPSEALTATDLANGIAYTRPSTTALIKEGLIYEGDNLANGNYIFVVTKDGELIVHQRPLANIPFEGGHLLEVQMLVHHRKCPIQAYLMADLYKVLVRCG